MSERKKSLNNREKGNQYEEKTREYLIDEKFKIKERNYNCRFGEVDIIAEDKEDLVFIEVKYRVNGDYGHPSESITYHKKRNIINVSRWYVHQYNKYDWNIRYDVAIWHKGKLEYYKGAFDYEG